MANTSRTQSSRRTKWTGPINLPGIGLFVLSLAWSLTAQGTTVSMEPPGAYVSPRLGDDEYLIDEVFQSHLPGTLEKYHLRLSVNPHLGDWEGKDYMRLTTTLRYGLTDRCELSASSNLYFSHGNGDVRAFEDYGAASLKLGAKFNLGHPLFATWETAVGADYEFPIGHPPSQLTDGLRHLRPYVTSSHRLKAHPNLRIFIGFRFDYVTETDLPGEFGKNAFHESSTGITGGWVLDRDRLHYTFEASYDTNRFIGHGGEDIFTIRPGLLWEIPTRGKSEIRSNWMTGFSANYTHGPGGSGFGGSFKLRYSSDLKNHLRQHPATPPPAAGP